MSKGMSYLLFCVLLSILFLIPVSKTEALALNPVSSKPFAGRVISDSIPQVSCFGGFGPITIIPIKGPPALYAGNFLTKKYDNGNTSTGSMLLGLYKPTLSFNTCYLKTKIPAPPFYILIPIPVFVIDKLGTS